MPRPFRLPDDPNRAARDVQSEVELHLELLAKELEAKGLSPAEARRQALASFGNPSAVVAECGELRSDTLRARRRREWFGDLRQDVRLAIRTLRRSPGFALVAILTLALGIGANAAIFSVVRSVLLAPLPYPEPDRLMQIWTDQRALGQANPEWLTPPDFVDWRRDNRSFAAMASYGGWGPDLTGDGPPEALGGIAVDWGYFQVLGIRPALGRDFTTADDDPGAGRVVILSDGIWQRRFGADRSIIGRAITLNGDPWTVIGVLPRDFRAPLPTPPDVWRPTRRPLNSGCGRACFVLRAVGRLRPGVTPAAAQQDLSTIAARLAREYPATNDRRGAWVIPLHEQLTGASRPALAALSGAVGFVLLIACVNLANLLLVRGSSRGRELALRSALGAGRARIVRQLLTESVVLAGLGGGLGLVAAIAARSVLVSAVPASLRALRDIEIDWLVLAFTAALSIGCGILFGLVPALRSTGHGLMQSLRTAGRGGSRQDGRLRNGLVVAELAISLVLLVGAGLLLQTFLSMQKADLGFRTEGLVTAGIAFPRTRYAEPARAVVAIEDLLGRLRVDPAVRAAEVTDLPPLGGAGDQDMSVEAVGEPPVENVGGVWYRTVSTGYLKLMRMRLVAGRFFNPSDRAGSGTVAIINQATARRYFRTKDPLGRILSSGPRPQDLNATVVGVVADARPDGAAQPVKPEIFVSIGQLPVRGVAVIIEPAATSEAALDALKRKLAEVDPLIPIASVSTLEQAVARDLAPSRTYALFVGIFSVAALVLASIGAYGVMAYAVVQRQREIGVRLALGAGQPAIRRLVLGEGLKLVAFGVGIGLLGAAVTMQAIRKLLFGVGAVDPASFTVAPLALAAVALVAAWVPARRASRIDPLVAIREE